MKTTKNKLPYAENLALADELRSLAEKWADTFNYIQLNVLETMAEKEDKSLSECIDHENRDNDESAMEFINDYMHADEFKKWNRKHKEGALSFVNTEYQNDFDDWKNEKEGQNYPMWNTCFEFKYNPTENMIISAKKAGFGVINGLDDFGTILFVSGAGYSFYAQHWIPLFLELPWNSELKKKYKDVDYSMM